MKHFSVSVWVKDQEFGVRQLGSIEDAQSYLAAWPDSGKGPFYHLAVHALGVAQRGQIEPDGAKETLLGFLESEGMLAEATIAS